MRKSLIFTIIIVSIILFVSYPKVKSFDENLTIKLQFKVYSRLVNLFDKNNEKKEIEINYPVIIVNNRSIIESSFFSSNWNFGKTTIINYEVVTKEVRYVFEDNDNNFLEIVIDTIKNQCKAFYNDYEQKIDDILFQPVIQDLTTKKTYYALPIRFIFETFGYSVEWIRDTQEIVVYK